MLFVNDKIEVLRMAPKREAKGLPFHVWMALAKAAPSVIAMDAQMLLDDSPGT